MQPLTEWEYPPLRLARLGFEISCLDARLAIERRRERRELDAPLMAPRVPRHAGLGERIKQKASFLIVFWVATIAQVTTALADVETSQEGRETSTGFSHSRQGTVTMGARPWGRGGADGCRPVREPS